MIKNAPQILKKNNVAEIITRLSKKFGIPKEKFKKRTLIFKNGDLFMTTKQATILALKNLHRRIGLKIQDKDKNITSEFAIHFGKYATKNVINLNKIDKNKFLEGYDLSISNELKNEKLKNGEEVLIKYKNFCLGHGKIVNGKIKNKLNRNLILN